MLYRMTLQTRGKKTGYYSHPKTIKVGSDCTEMVGALKSAIIGKQDKVSLWELNEKSGEWERIAVREGL